MKILAPKSNIERIRMLREQSGVVTARPRPREDARLVAAISRRRQQLERLAAQMRDAHERLEADKRELMQRALCRWDPTWVVMEEDVCG